MSQRSRFLQVAEDLEGISYLWGGKRLADGGLDCSGFVTHCRAKALGEQLRVENADALWRSLEPVEHPIPGDLAFYGTREKATHVVVCTPTGVIGASGGGSATTSTEIARAVRPRPAAVRREPTPGYRRDFLGFRRLPFKD